MTKCLIVSLYSFLRYNCKGKRKTPSGKGGEETRGGRDDATVKINLFKEKPNPLHHSIHNITSLTRKFKYYFLRIGETFL